MKEKLKFEGHARNPEAASLHLVHTTALPQRELSLAADNSLLARQSLLRSEITSHILEHDCPIAAALVVIRPDGATELSIVGVEPEQAGGLADGLDQLATRLRLHAKRRPVRPTMRGAASVTAIATLAFAMVTYVNDIAWLDATLSLVAQITAAWLATPNKRRPRYPHAEWSRGD